MSTSRELRLGETSLPSLFVDYKSGWLAAKQVIILLKYWEEAETKHGNVYRAIVHRLVADRFEYSLLKAATSINTAKTLRDDLFEFQKRFQAEKKRSRSDCPAFITSVLLAIHAFREEEEDNIPELEEPAPSTALDRDSKVPQDPNSLALALAGLEKTDGSGATTIDVLDGGSRTGSLDSGGIDLDELTIILEAEADAAEADLNDPLSGASPS